MLACILYISVLLTVNKKGKNKGCIDECAALIPNTSIQDCIVKPAFLNGGSQVVILRQVFTKDSRQGELKNCNNYDN